MVLWVRFLWFVLAGSLIGSSALAQTSISGPLTTNTHWTTTAAPYQLEGNVVLQNGAVLTIDSGVTVLMGPGASLTVQSGSIQAVGNSLNPIQVRSSRGGSAASGDWKQWVFTSGTVNTHLEYMVFEHGSGLLVQGSAPVFNFLEIWNHQGAAITVDLAASPTGVGNRDSGNTLDGIVVPAGDIRSDVKWGLRGIPYLLLSGSVSIGESPLISSITPDTLEQGETVTVTASGSRLQGLSDIQFDREGFSTEILPGGTDTQARFSVTASPSATPGPVGLRLLVDTGSIRLDSGLAVTALQPVLLSLSPSVLYVNQGAIEVLADGHHLTDQFSLWINGVPSPTEFVSSTRLRTFITAPATPGNLKISLRAPDLTKPGEYLNFNSLTLPVVSPQLLLQPGFATLVKGSSKDFILALPYPAPIGGSTVNLVSSVPAVTTVPATLTVPEGHSLVNFQLAATNTGSTVVTASKVGFVSGQAQVTVTPPPTITLTPVTLALGIERTAILNVQLSELAGASGLAVNLASSNPAVATVDNSVTIPAGTRSTTAQISTVAAGSTTITAQATDFVSNSTIVTVRLFSLTLPPSALVAPGLTRSIPLTLSDPAPEGGLLVTLTSDQPTFATVPTSVMIPEGQTATNFTLTGVSAGTASINVTANGYQSAVLPVTVEVVTLGIGNPAVSSLSVVEGSTTPALAVTLSRPAPAGGVTVDLEMSDTEIATVSPSSLTIAAGETSGGMTQISLRGVAKGKASLSASAAGLKGVTVPVTITDKKGKPDLSFSRNIVTVGKGLKNYFYEITVARRTDGSLYASNEALTVNLVSSDPDKVSVPTTVTIPAGKPSVYFQVAGVDLTGAAPVTIDASATGYSAPATQLAVKVVTPVLIFDSLDTNRSLASQRDNFRVYLNVPGAYYPTLQVPVSDLLIDLSIVEDNPAGIVDSFYSALTGGTGITQVLLPTNAGNSSSVTYSNYAYVGVPTTGGSYKVQARTEVSSATSAVQNVVTPELRFSRSSVTVGKGLKNYSSEVYVYRAISGTSFSGNEAVTVSLTCSSTAICAVPATVTIPAGKPSVYFQVEGIGVGNTTITVNAVGYTAIQDLVVNTVPAQLNFSGPGNTGVGGQVNFYVHLTVPGATYPSNQVAVSAISVDLTSSAPGVATVPLVLTIPVGSVNSNTTQLKGIAAGTTALTASSPGFMSGTSSTITVSP